MSKEKVPSNFTKFTNKSYLKSIFNTMTYFSKPSRYIPNLGSGVYITISLRFFILCTEY